MFFHRRAWWTSSLKDHDHLYKLSMPFRQKDLHEENWPKVFRGVKLFKGVNEWMDNKQMDNGQQVITIAHPEPLAQVP